MEQVGHEAATVGALCVLDCSIENLLRLREAAADEGDVGVKHQGPAQAHVVTGCLEDRSRFLAQRYEQVERPLPGVELREGGFDIRSGADPIVPCGLCLSGGLVEDTLRFPKGTGALQRFAELDHDLEPHTIDTGLESQSALEQVRSGRRVSASRRAPSRRGEDVAGAPPERACVLTQWSELGAITERLLQVVRDDLVELAGATGVRACGEVREPLEILEEIESVLSIDCAPVSWPVGMGKRFRGVFDLQRDRLKRFSPGEERVAEESELIEGVDNPRLAELFPDEVAALRHDVDLIRSASHPFDIEAFLAGRQTPVFFGSAINNFGVQEILQALTDWAPPPQPRDGGSRVVNPPEPAFSGFVFKIQANMDPNHRDRIAFFRVCSGRYRPAMKVRHLRTGREMKLSNVLTFMANERVASEDAVAGDIIGIHNHGQLSIGDTLSEGEVLEYKGIPYFAPELFRVARPRDPFRSKPLQKGLRELGEEGAIQVFESIQAGTLLLGAVGPLQFEIVAHRLATEYKVDAIYDSANISTARWLTFPDDSTRRNFEREQAAALATDVDDNPVFLATNKYNLQVTMERWPKVGFHATREHGRQLEHV